MKVRREKRETESSGFNVGKSGALADPLRDCSCASTLVGRIKLISLGIFVFAEAFTKSTPRSATPPEAAFESRRPSSHHLQASMRIKHVQ